MDQIFDRLGNLLKSVFQDDGSSENRQKDHNPDFPDPDLQDAWDELEDFMKTGETTEKINFPPAGGIPSDLKRDYEFLGIPFDASKAEIAKTYKKLLIKHHPDRHAGNKNNTEKATEVTKKINLSFQRIKIYKETLSD